MRGHRTPFVLSIALVGCAIESPSTTTIESAVTHAVVPEKELVITDPSVIEAPIETTFDPAHPSGSSPHGAWSFGRLVHNMLPTADRDSPMAASQFVLRWLATWETDQAPNAAVSPAGARPSIRMQITNPWKAASGCADPASPATDATCVLDMTKAPFRLMAIFNRPDLRIVAGDDRSIGGEGRFVFQVMGPTLGINATTGVLEVMDPAVTPQKFTVIFEYSLPVNNDGQTITWAQQWHQLGTMPFGTAFNALLLGLTRDFSAPDKDTRRPNGNALNQLRTNEVSLMGTRLPIAGFIAAPQVWELREFHLEPHGLVPHTVNLEPSRDFDVMKPTSEAPEGTRTNELVDFLLEQAQAVLAMRFALPAGMSGNSSLVGPQPYGAWGKLTNPTAEVPPQGSPHDLDGVAVDVRDAFAINTCAGCHRHETSTAFTHVVLANAPNASGSFDVVKSAFLLDEVSPGGARFNDFTQLIVTKRVDLRDKPGLRACR